MSIEPKESEIIYSILSQLRKQRDNHQFNHAIWKTYNEACDCLDVLESLLLKKEKENNDKL